MKIRITQGPGLPKAQAGGEQEPTSLKVNGVLYTPTHPQWAQVLSDYKTEKAEADQLRAQVNNRFSNNPALNQKMNNFNNAAAQQTGKPTLAQSVVPAMVPTTAPAMVPQQQPTSFGADLNSVPNQFTPTGNKTSPFTWQTSGTTPAAPAQKIQSMQQTVKTNAAKPLNTPPSVATNPAKPGYMNAFSPFGTLATMDNKTGMIDNPLGQVSKMDTRALGFNDDGSRNDAQTINVNKLASQIGQGIQTGVATASMFANYFDNNKKAKAAKDYMRSQQMTDNLYTAQETDRGDYVQTGMQTGMLRPDEYTVNKGMFMSQGGSVNNQTMKIRITGQAPQMAYGGQVKPGGSFDSGGRNVYTQMPAGPTDSVSSTMPISDRENADLEAELGEVIRDDVDSDGQQELMNIPGKPHSQGGTPLQANAGAFIYSKKLKEKNPDVLKEFGKTYKRGGYAYADLAKQYPINKYKAILEDPNADALAKSTAQLMVNNYNAKLDKLAMAQEAGKGFPTGVPKTQTMQPQMAMGGELPAYQNAGEFIFTKEMQEQLKNLKEKNGLNPTYSNRILSGDNSIAAMQSRQKSGLYGDITTNELDEFKKRHNWYFNNKTNWNPANKKDVLDFQNSFKAEAKKKGLDYFTGTRKFDRPDGMMGEYTYNAPILDAAPAAAPPPVVTAPPVVQKQPYVTQAGTMGTAQATAVPFEYMAPDQFNMLAAMANAPKRYNPYIAPTKLTKAQPTFTDPARELAANAEMYNQTVAGAANFGNPQAYMANASKASGDALANAANILGRYNNQNVGTANQFATMNTEVDNKQALIDAERATMLRQMYATTGQNMDNAKRDYLDRIGKANAKRFDNRMNLDLINQTIPQYYTDPRTGKTIFKGGFNAFTNAAAKNNNGMPQTDEEWQQSYADYLRQAAATGMTYPQYLNFKKTGKVTLTDANNDGVAESSRTTVNR